MRQDLGALQELRGGKWVNLQMLTWKKTSGYSSTSPAVRTPVTWSTTARTYRVVVNPSRTEAAYISKAVTIRHENPAHYTGYHGLSYSYMKAYCPRQIIELKSPGFSYSWPQSRKIQIATGYGTGGPLKYVSLHECAHIRQFAVYNDDFSAWPDAWSRSTAPRASSRTPTA